LDATPKKASSTAQITVNLPSEAKVYIEGVETPSSSDKRVFVTPDLKAGTVYYYTISAEIVRDGKKLIATEKIAVRAGSDAKITLNPDFGTAVANK
jgi:uncharacterized protein (TIGR03000 family)